MEQLDSDEEQGSLRPGRSSGWGQRSKATCVAVGVGIVILAAVILAFAVEKGNGIRPDRHITVGLR
jgi:hypothetical protein